MITADPQIAALTVGDTFLRAGMPGEYVVCGPVTPLPDGKFRLLMVPCAGEGRA